MKEILLLEKKDNVVYTNELDFDKGLIVVKTIGGQLIGTVVRLNSKQDFVIMPKEIETNSSLKGVYTLIKGTIWNSLDILIKANKSYRFFLIE